MKLLIKSILTIALMIVLGVMVYVWLVAELTPMEWWLQAAGVLTYVILMNVGLKHTWLKWN